METDYRWYNQWWQSIKNTLSDIKPDRQLVEDYIFITFMLIGIACTGIAVTMGIIEGIRWYLF